MLPQVVHAKTYYTDYGPWQETDTLVFDTPLQQGKVIQKYKMYQEEKEYTEKYYAVGENPLDYPYQSTEKQVQPFSIWSKEMPVSKQDRLIETKITYPYQELKKISTLVLYDIDGPKNKLYLSEIEVLHQGKKIPVQFQCENCNSDLLFQVGNGILNETSFFLSKNSVLTIQLPKEYSPIDLTCNVYLSDFQNTSPIQFKLGTETNDTKPYIEVFHTYWIDPDQSKYVDSIALKEYISYPQWDDLILESDVSLEENDMVHVLDPITYYRYQDTYYKYYRMRRNYLDGYYGSVKNYRQDESQSINLYYKRTRDQIVTHDVITLTKPNLTVQDLIVSSTVPLEKLHFSHNIDWNKNGTYTAHLVYEEQSMPISIQLKLSKENKKEGTDKKEAVSLIKKLSQWFTWKNILLSLLLGLGIFLIVYSLQQIVERKK